MSQSQFSSQKKADKNNLEETLEMSNVLKIKVTLEAIYSRLKNTDLRRISQKDIEMYLKDVHKVREVIYGFKSSSVSVSYFRSIDALGQNLDDIIDTLYAVIYLLNQSKKGDIEAKTSEFRQIFANLKDCNEYLREALRQFLI